MPTQFEDLNNDCIRLILLNFQVLELLQLRAVSTRWQTVVEVIFLSKHTVKIFPNHGRILSYFKDLVRHNLQDDPYYQLQDNDPDELVGYLADDEANQYYPVLLAPLLPNITKAVIVFKMGDNTDLNGLLEQWPSLESLTLFGNRVGFEALPCDAIKAMVNLKRLELFNFDLESIEVAELQPMLSKLEHFTMANYALPQTMQQRITRPRLPPVDHVTPFLMALNPVNLRRLTLSHVLYTHQQLVNFFNSKPELPSNLTHLTIAPGQQERFGFNFGLTTPMLELISERCTALECLQFDYLAKLSFVSMFRSLGRMTQLTELKIHFNEVANTGEANLQSVQRFRLPGIHRLQLAIINPPDDVCLPLLLYVFPSLDQLTLTVEHATRVMELPDEKRLINYSLANAEERFFGPRLVAKVAAAVQTAQAAANALPQPENSQNVAHYWHRVFTVERLDSIQEAERHRRFDANFLNITDQIEFRIEEIQRQAEQVIDRHFDDLRNFFMAEFRDIMQNVLPVRIPHHQMNIRVERQNNVPPNIGHRLPMPVVRPAESEPLNLSANQPRRSARLQNIAVKEKIVRK